VVIAHRLVKAQSAGGRAEAQLRRALSISLGDPMVLLQSPVIRHSARNCPDRVGRSLHIARHGAAEAIED
jgi:hypothetical protein